MAITKPFENFFSKAFSSVLGGADDWIESFDPFQFGKQYREIVEGRYSTVKILGMAKPVSLSALYVDVIAFLDIPSRIYEDIETLERFLAEKTEAEAYQDRYKRRNALDVVTSNNRVVILGRPGGGKTTFLQYVLYSLVGASPPYGSVPIFLSLREYLDSPQKSILQFATDQLDKYGRFPGDKAKLFLRRLLKEGKTTILLDGLDEVPRDARQPIVAEIDKMASTYPDSHWIVSCRTADYDGWFTKFEEIEIADFTKQQSTQFICNWFESDPERASQLTDAIDASDGLGDLTSTPLLCALICILFQYNLSLPSNRAELYSECIDSLLFRWDASRLVSRPSKFADLSTHRKKIVLADVAVWLMEDQKVVVTKDRLISLLTEPLSRFDIKDSHLVLAELAAHHGMFIERASGMWSFLHLTFQEYFAALYIVQNRQEKYLLENHYTDKRWREVTLMVSSLLPNVEDFLEAQAKAITTSELFIKLKPVLPSIFYFYSGGLDQGENRGPGLADSKKFVEAFQVGRLEYHNKISCIKELRSRKYSIARGYDKYSIQEPALTSTMIESMEKLYSGSGKLDDFIDDISALDGHLEILHESLSGDVSIRADVVKKCIAIIFNSIG